MFANPQSFGLWAPSSASLAVPRIPSGNGSRGSWTAGQIVQPASPESLQPARRAMPSIGSLVIQYGKELVSTASSHTILDGWRLPIVLVEEVETLAQLADPGVPRLSKILEEIESLTGLHKVRIAEDLFGVTREAYHNWSTGGRASIENERRIRGTLDVLRRASARLGDPSLVRGWLATPVGSRALTPMSLLKDRTDEARLLAMSALPKRGTALPDWLLTGPINEWSDRDQKRRDFVVRESAVIAKATNDD